MLRRTGGFSLLEVLVAGGLLALLLSSAFQLYRGGNLQSRQSTEQLSSMQNALLMMSALEEDCRQITVLNRRGYSMVPFTLLFSTNRKSLMMRTSSMTDTDGNAGGSSFTVVIYQLERHATVPGTYTMRRLERTTDGRLLPGTDRVEEDKAFRALPIVDIRYDMVVRMEDLAYRTYLRASLTAVDTSADPRNPRVFALSRVFEIQNPEFIHSEPAREGEPPQPGFARRFFQSNRWNVGAGGVVRPGEGYLDVLPPSSWPDAALYGPFRDYMDGKEPKDFDVPPSTAPNAFDVKDLALPTVRRQFVATAVGYIQDLVSKDFEGRITGAVTGPDWTERYAFEIGPQAKKQVAAQMNDLLTRLIPRGPEAILELGHTFFARIRDKPQDCRTVSMPGGMLSTCEAKLLVAGQ